MDALDELDEVLSLYIDEVIQCAVVGMQRDYPQCRTPVEQADQGACGVDAVAAAYCSSRGRSETSDDNSDENKCGNEDRIENTRENYDENSIRCAADRRLDGPEDEDNFCIVNIDGSCDDITLNEYKDKSRSDSMINLYDEEDLDQLRNSDREDPEGENVQNKDSGEDLHSTPSSATLTNASSSTSNQYKPSEDKVPTSVADTLKTMSTPIPLPRKFKPIPGSPTRCEKSTMTKRSDIISQPLNLEVLSMFTAEELKELVIGLNEKIIEQDQDLKEGLESREREMHTNEEWNKLCDIIEYQKHQIYGFICDREQLQEFVLKREKEYNEVVDRLQAECLRLRKHNTAAIENRIRHGERMSKSMADNLLKAKYDADKMLTDSLHKQSKINELRLHMLEQQQRIQDLELIVVNLRNYVEGQSFENDSDNSDAENASLPENIWQMANETGSSGLSEVYNCDNMDQAPASGQYRCPQINTLNAFSVYNRRRRRPSSDSQQSDRSGKSDGPSGGGNSHQSDRETTEEMEAYLRECQLSIEKSMVEY